MKQILLPFFLTDNSLKWNVLLSGESKVYWWNRIQYKLNGVLFEKKIVTEETGSSATPQLSISNSYI